jgi:hypothetical protein
MKRTIIYVFGPKRLSAKYFANSEMNQQEGGWLKIGQTSTEDDSKDKWECAINRIKGETHTGIPEVSQLYDVFEYPFKEGNNDDVLRTILAEDIYSLECSKSHNREVEKYEIKAGREFVYGVTRSQVMNAIAKYERNLILEYYQKETFDYLMQLIQRNNAIDEVPFEPNDTANPSEEEDSKDNWCNQLWDKVISRIQLNVNITNPKDRPYIFFKSPSNSQLSYVLGYSVRYGITSVSVETYQGETLKDSINDFISENDIRVKIPDLKLNQGVKNKEKWAWSVSDTLDKTDNELIDWFVSTLLLFFQCFEK